MKYILTVIILGTIIQSEPKIEGKWKIQSYGAIDNIKLSPAYTFGDPDTKEQIDELFRLMLEKGEYHFQNDTLIYTDIEKQKLVKRRAIYKNKDGILTITEIDRPYERQAEIYHLSNDSLIILPIIEGKSGSKLIFKKVK